jgi:hypothetical protein
MHCFRLLCNKKDSLGQAANIPNQYDFSSLAFIGKDYKLGHAENIVEEINIKLVFGLLANC